MFVPDPELAGYVNVEGGRIWWRMNGIEHRDRAAAVVCITGGPGMSHHYMVPFLALADERPLVLYDQLDTGNADRPGDPANWTIARFVDEIRLLRTALDLDRVVLAGHSWGSMLALESWLAGAPGITGLVLASPAVSIRRWNTDAAELVSELPAEMQEVIARATETGVFDTPDFKEATRLFFRRHILRGDAVPDFVERSFSMFGEKLYFSMNGPSEFTVLGVIRDYEREGDLGRVTVPTMITCGEFDNARPSTCLHYASLMPNAEVAVFPGAAHFTFADRPDDYIERVRQFLTRQGI